MQYITAYGALVHHGKITKNDFVIITAASSSVGIAAIEICREQGATSIAITRTRQKKAELLALGAAHLIVSNEEDILIRVKQITNNQGARVIFDPIAGPGIEKFATASANQGLIYIYGNLSGEPTPFPLPQARAKGISIRGYTLFEIVSTPNLRTKAERYIYEHIENGAFKPKIARSFTLDQIIEAHKYMQSNEQIGKIMITI
ncbi:zinc-binding dehydrogenase [Legionella sp.]|uniref:zinc-binding dehydrogenase n=1 Tax=Legionella sp. TaxID=459 RepID=UPI0039E3AD96